MNPSYRNTIILRSLLLVLTTAAAVFSGIYHRLGLVVVFSLALVVQLALFYRMHSLVLKEFRQFVESVQYHDFSQHFNIGGTRGNLVEFRQGFNIINKVFLDIAREKEKQYQYLQKMLELVDTGILLYDMQSGDVVWMNDALKTMLGIPYFKNLRAIHWRHPQLYETIQSISGKKQIMLSLHKDKNRVQVQLSSSVFKVDGSQMNLLVFQNVNEVIDVTETQAWNKLLRVLTHEIMNSVAPISSLASTISRNLKEYPHFRDDDILLGIETIKSRSEGLIQFAEAYRSLNKIEKPQRTTFLIRDMFESLDMLFDPRLLQYGIELEIILPETNLEVSADHSLLEQVFINLILNAIDAVRTVPQPCIQLFAAKGPANTVLFKVVDNGVGMDEKTEERIFIPFFSTKGGGSGIGLSLCKQIVLLHGGNIAVHSRVNAGTVFSISL